MVATEDVRVEGAGTIAGWMEELAYAATVCRSAAHALGSVEAVEVVAALAGIHERDLAQLRRFAPEFGVDGPPAGTEEESEALGRMRLAQWREGDAGVLAIVRDAERRVARSYAQVRDDLAAPGEIRRLAEAGLEEVARRHQRLDAAARVAG
jgi:hypothetical protein